MRHVAVVTAQGGANTRSRRSALRWTEWIGDDDGDKQLEHVVDGM